MEGRFNQKYIICLREILKKKKRKETLLENIWQVFKRFPKSKKEQASAFAEPLTGDMQVNMAS